MSLKFIFGPSGSGKTCFLYQSVIEESMKNPDRSYLVIVPEQFTLQTQKALVTTHPNHGIMNIDVLSFNRLAHRIFDAAGGDDKAILDDTGKSLILRLVASGKEEELKVLSGNLHKLGYINEIKSVISEFAQYDIGTKELSEMIAQNEKKPVLQYKLQDIKVLYESFEQFIHEKYIMKEELLDRALVAADRAEFLKDAVIVFDGFTGFTPVQNRFLQKMMMLTKQVIVTVLLGAKENPYQADGEQKLFHLSKKTVDMLIQTAGLADCKRDEDVFLRAQPVQRLANAKSLAFLETNLFRYNNAVFEEKPEELSVYEAATPEQEAVRVCRQICCLVREEGYRYRDIAIIMGDQAAYERVLQENFEKYEIPFFMDTTRGILLNPFTEFIRAAIEVVTSDFNYESVFHYLKTGLSGFDMALIDEVENYVRACGIKGKGRYRKPWTRLYGRLDEERLTCFNEFRESFYGQFEELTKVMSTTKKTSAGALTRVLYGFITEHEVQKQLKQRENFFKEAGEMARAREYAQIYGMIMDLFDQIMGLLAEEEVTLKEYSDILDAGFGEIRVGMIPPGVDQVVAGDMQRTRLCDVKALFFMGMNDGMVPKAGGSGGIISQMDREILHEMKVELAPTTRQQSFIQRLYLYMNLTKPSKRLYISYAQVAGDGSALRPSYFIGTLLKMYPKLAIKRDEEQKGYQDIMTVSEGISLLIDGLHDSDSDDFKELYQLLREDEQVSGLVEKLIQVAFLKYEPEPISRAVSRVLYGTVLKNSVTRLEQFASCAYAHFVHYGLRLQEREEFSFDPSDMGSVFHAALEEYAKLIAKSPFTWETITEEEASRMAEEAMELAVSADNREIFESSARNEYAVTRMNRILQRTVQALTAQVRKGAFVPNEYEVAFSESTDLSTIDIELSEDEKLSLRGRIDRLDTVETADKVYVKIIDYKSGAKTFDLVSVYYGLQLQLVVYMNAAMEIEKKRNPDKEIIPAGILYYHIDDPVVERGELDPSGSEEGRKALNQQILKELSMKGLVNSDEAIIHLMDEGVTGKSDVIPVAFNKDGSLSKTSSAVNREELELISSYVNKKTAAIGRDILNGEIEVNPYELGTHSACDYCNYRSICGYDESLPGFHKRKLAAAKAPEVLARMAYEQRPGEVQS